jgi:molecular chaperone HscB
MARNLVIELNYFANIDTVCKEWQPGKRIELQH